MNKDKQFKRYRKALNEISKMMGKYIHSQVNLYNAVITAKMALNPKHKYEIVKIE